MKTLSINVNTILLIVIALLAFYTKALPADTNPKVILWMMAAGSALSLVAKTLFPSGQWIGKGQQAAFWVLNIGVILSGVLTDWGGIGLVNASFVAMAIGTINVLLTGLGVKQTPTA
jgi:hypothetical protein